MVLDEKYPLALPQGTILAGQYVIEQTLGQGGFGITYKATDHKTGQNVAVKEFFPDSMASRTTQTTVTAFPGERGESFVYGKGCFLQEAETLAEFIGNENIVRVYSYFEENGTAYFVMEFIEGTSFDQYIKEQGGKISYEEAEKILLPVIDALALVHAKGIVHRDVTPDNIYITKDGKVKLLDFGAARYSLGDKSRSLDVVLKHGFAPKEQYTRHGKQGPFTDVYTVGASFYFAITGRRPPDSIDRIEEDELISPSSLGVKIASDKEDAILKAMSVQPSNRYQTMGEFHRALMGAGEAGIQQSASTQAVQGAMPAQESTPPQVQQRVFTAPQSTPVQESPLNVEPQPVPQFIQTPQESMQPQAEGKKKWILPAGIGAGVVLAVAVIIGVVSSGKDKEKEPVHYEQEEEPTIATNIITEPEIPVSDTTEVPDNLLKGNTSNNISEYGQVVIYNDEIYLCYPGGCGLIKTGDSGDEWIEETGYIRCLNAVDDTIYYINRGVAYSASTDGTGKTLLPELADVDTIATFWVTDSGYYYYKFDSGLVYVKKGSKTGEGYIKCAGDYNGVIFLGGDIYYLKESGTGSALYRAKGGNLTETPEKLIGEGEIASCSRIVSYGEYIYCLYFTDEKERVANIAIYDVNKGSIINTYSFDSEVGWDWENEDILAMNASGGYVYFAVGTGDLYSSGYDKVYRFYAGEDGGSNDVPLIYTLDAGEHTDYMSILEFDDGDVIILNAWHDNYHAMVTIAADGSGEPIILKDTDFTESAVGEIQGNRPANIVNDALFAMEGKGMALFYPGRGLTGGYINDGDVYSYDSDNVHSISIVDGVIYYVDGSNCACKVGLDNSNLSYISELSGYDLRQLWVAENGYYFVTWENELYSYESGIGVSGPIRLYEYTSPVFYEGDLYYTPSSDPQGLYRIRNSNIEGMPELICRTDAVKGTLLYGTNELDGTGMIYPYVAADGYLYAVYSEIGKEYETIIQIDLDSGSISETIVYVDSYGRITSVNEADGYIYYSVYYSSTGEAGIERFKTSVFSSGNGTFDTIWTGYAGVIGKISVVPEGDMLVFYKINSEGKRELVLSDLDGSEEPYTYSND